MPSQNKAAASVQPTTTIRPLGPAHRALREGSPRTTLDAPDAKASQTEHPDKHMGANTNMLEHDPNVHVLVLAQRIDVFPERTFE